MCVGALHLSYVRKWHRSGTSEMCISLSNKEQRRLPQHTTTLKGLNFSCVSRKVRMWNARRKYLEKLYKPDELKIILEKLTRDRVQDPRVELHVLTRLIFHSSECLSLG